MQYIDHHAVLVTEGTDTSQGTPQLLSNIAACLAIATTISSTLGPRGMDKLIVTATGQATISNDGATILKLLEVVHPAAKTLVDIARAQDAEVGDGTTSVVLLAAEFLRESKTFIEDGVSPHVIIKGYRKAAQLVSSRGLFFRPRHGELAPYLLWLLLSYVGYRKSQGDCSDDRPNKCCVCFTRLKRRSRKLITGRLSCQ